jgi:hypothetical protein
MFSSVRRDVKGKYVERNEIDIAIEMEKERRYLDVDEAFKGPVRRNRSLSPLQAATHPLVYAESLCTLWMLFAAC